MGTQGLRGQALSGDATGCRAAAGRHEKRAMTRPTCWRVVQGYSATVLLGLLAAGLPAIGDAEVNVAGSVEAISVVSSDASISEILSAMTATFGVRYRTETALDDIVNANYSGSLKEITSRLLVDYNYIIRHDGETVEIIVFGRHGGRPPAVQPPPPAPSKSFAAQWR